MVPVPPQQPIAVISTVIRFQPPLDSPPAQMLRAEGGLSVELEDGRRVLFNRDDPRSIGFVQILDGLNKQGLPVYLEIDPETSFISRLLIPHITPVTNIRPIDDGVLGVELQLSHARHVLRSSQPNFAELEQVLREALKSGTALILTEDDAHNIIDVRPFKPNPDRPPPLPPFPEPEPFPRLPWLPLWVRNFLHPIWYWKWWPWWWWLWFDCISATRAQQVFNAMNATSCNPLTVPSPCIPFMYPDDGCWARAHEMCRLMINMGLSPRKVWIRGSLHVSTRNNPTCGVYWGWHVAPTLCVRGPSIFQTQRMVIDPSLFTLPVSEAVWKGVQGDPYATLTDTDASIFIGTTTTDPTYVQTNNTLAFYRLQLQNRALQYGSPPYANCP